MHGRQRPTSPRSPSPPHMSRYSTPSSRWMAGKCHSSFWALCASKPSAAGMSWMLRGRRGSRARAVEGREGSRRGAWPCDAACAACTACNACTAQHLWKRGRSWSWPRKEEATCGVGVRLQVVGRWIQLAGGNEGSQHRGGKGARAQGSAHAGQRSSRNYGGGGGAQSSRSEARLATASCTPCALRPSRMAGTSG